MSAIDKILTNTSASTIPLDEVGIEIAAGDSYTLTLDEYLRYANPDAIAEITPYINSGDIVVNDGNVNLAAADGIRFLKYADRAYIQKDDVDVTQVSTVLNFEGDVDIVDEGDGKATITIGETGQYTGKLVDFIFFSSGNTADKWLAFGNGSTASDTLPMVFPQDGHINALTFSNEDDNVDIDVEFYINGPSVSNKVYTWEIRNKRTAFKTNLPHDPLHFYQGDRLSIFVKKYIGGTGDSTAQDPVLEVLYAMESNYLNEGGQQSGD